MSDEADLQRELEGCDDAELLEFMAAKASEVTWARAAFAEFYQRHREYLWLAIGGQYGGLGDGFMKDVLQDTFLRAYEKADRFKRRGPQDGNSVRRHVRAWLGKIATRCATDVLRNRRSPKLVLVDDDEKWESELDRAQDPAAGEPEEPPGEENQPWLEDLARSAIEQLNPREMEVMLATLDYYEPDGTARRLPRDVIAGLERSLQTTSANIRKIRQRALAKLRELLDADRTAVGAQK